jgi:putative heme iron utilization protein
MNKDHGEVIDLYATRLAGRTGQGWRLIGIDPEGIDLRLGGTVERLDFREPVRDARSAREALVQLAQQAREQS